ncbi:MAG: LuxR C-terminal-related transcriptional regulator [Bacteroidales bacterium]
MKISFWNRRYVLHGLLGLCLSFGLFGQETPPIVKFSPSDYKAENQNWAIAQDSKGFIYAANNEGLLEYNGAEWTLYPSPNNTITRSLLADGERIYSGAYMEFGCWERDRFGKLRYTSLASGVRNQLVEDENIWSIKSVSQWIVFQSTHRLYFYNTTNGEIHFTDDPNNYRRIFDLNGQIYIHKSDGRFSSIDGGDEKVLVRLPQEHRIALVLNIFEQDGGILLLTRARGFFLVNEGRVTKWDTDIDGMLGDLQVFSGIRLKDKSFILGTISHGILHLSPEGKLINTVNQSNGLSNNTILNLFEDRSGNVWAALDNGIDCIDMQSFIKEYNDNRGSFGTTYCSIVFNNTLYVGTNQGLFHKPAFSNVSLEPVEGSGGQVWSLFPYGEDLLCGHTLGVYLVRGNQSIRVSDNPGVWNFKPVPGHPEWLLIGHYSGMGILQKKDGRWTLRNTIGGFETSTRFFEFSSDREVWINHEYKGVYRVRLDPSYTAVEEAALLDYIPLGKGSALTKVDGDLIYCYEKGIFHIQPDEGRIRKDTALSRLIDGNEYVSGKLVFDDEGRLWAFNENSMRYAEKAPVPGEISIKTIPIPNNWRKTTVSFENITHLDGNRYIIGKTNGYILVDLNLFQSETHRVHLNGVTLRKADTTLVFGLEEEGRFKFKDGTLRFHYSVPCFPKYKMIQFQYRIEGLQDGWSPWTTSTRASFEKLPVGTHEFQLRSKIGTQLSDNVATYRIRVSRPTYLSNLAIAGYLVLLFLLSLLVHALYKNHYIKLQEEMMRENQRKYELAKIQSEQEVVKLRNERLKDEIEAKNRELAISTMSIIKRNEFLRSIRKDLKRNTSLAEDHSVYQLIEQNLNSSRDWDFFHEAFNNADKDFLKKAKELHPHLTHHDLKFCAYLRLNLSSKEIAPLLNISTKSVEVRRYRLRKKLNLPHGVNLTDYILNL